MQKELGRYLFSVFLEKRKIDRHLKNIHLSLNTIIELWPRGNPIHISMILDRESVNQKTIAEKNVTIVNSGISKNQHWLQKHRRQQISTIR